MSFLVFAGTPNRMVELERQPGRLPKIRTVAPSMSFPKTILCHVIQGAWMRKCAYRLVNDDDNRLTAGYPFAGWIEFKRFLY